MIEKFKYFCTKVLPTVYEDSLSYYEVLNKMSAKLNEVIDSENETNNKVDRAIEMIEEFEDHIGELFGEHTAEVEAALDEMREEISSFEDGVDDQLEAFMRELTTTIQTIVADDIDDMYYQGMFNNLIGLKKNIVFIGVNTAIKSFMNFQFDSSYKHRGINIGYVEGQSFGPTNNQNSIYYKLDNGVNPTWMKMNDSDITPSNNSYVTDVVLLINADEINSEDAPVTQNEFYDMLSFINTQYPNARVSLMPAFISIASYDILHTYYNWISSTSVNWKTGLIYLLASADYNSTGTYEYKIGGNEPFLGTMVEDVIGGSPAAKYRKRTISLDKNPTEGDIGVSGKTNIYFDGRYIVFRVHANGDEPSLDILNDADVSVFGDASEFSLYDILPNYTLSNTFASIVGCGRQYGTKPSSNFSLLTLTLTNITIPATNHWVYDKELKFAAF